MLRFLRGRSRPAPAMSPIARKVKDGHLTYLNDEKLARIERTIEDVYGYIDNLYDRVVENFARFGEPVDGRRVSLHKGYFEDTLHPATDIAFAHVDCDWYDPVKLCLQRIVPRLSAGGYLIFDDYHDYGGCRRAVDEFIEAGADVDIVAPEPNFVVRRRG